MIDPRYPIGKFVEPVDPTHESRDGLIRQITRELRHPESGLQPMDRLLGLYAWHGRHHVAHVLGVRPI